MPALKPLYFTASLQAASSATAWAESARRIEALGYDAFSMGDHFRPNFLAATPALMAAAAATSTLRIGVVYDNDFRHPALLAKETATLDLLSDGRLNLGLGAGWFKREYDQTGIPFDPPGVRIEKLQETVHILKGLWSGDTFSFTGKHYTITEMQGWPKPLQQPHPSIFIGGGGKRLLRFAAREADIVGLIAQALPSGVLDMANDSEALLAEKVSWVREAAGERFEQLALSIVIWDIAVSDNPRASAEELASARGLSVERVLTSPFYLIGSVDGIAERVVELRERFGISNFMMGYSDALAFAPVLTKLAGQ